MKKHKLVLFTAAFLLAGAGTAAAAIGGPGQVHTSRTSDHNVTGSSLSQLYEFKVTIAGDELQLPISYQELKARGWTMKEEAPWEGAEVYTEQQLVGGFDIVFPQFYKGNITISAEIVNGETTARSIKDLEVTALSLSASDINGSETGIVLPGNIVLGRSTEADMLAAYGQPENDGIGDGARYRSFIYELSEHQCIYFYHDNDESKVINLVTLVNQKDLYDKGMEYINNFQRSPEVLAYTAPAGLGDNIAKGTFQIKGDIYQSPVPLAAFIDNGWEIQSSALYIYYLDPGEVHGIVLTRNDDTLSLTVRNDGTTRGPIQNCFTYQIAESPVLPGGIQVNSSRSDLLNALQGINYTVDEENWEYRVICEDQKYEVLIYVNNYDDLVSYIMISAIKQD